MGSRGHWAQGGPSGCRGHRDPGRPVREQGSPGPGRPLAGANLCAQKHMEKRDTWPRGPLLRVVTRWDAARGGRARQVLRHQVLDVTIPRDERSTSSHGVSDPGPQRRPSPSGSFPTSEKGLALGPPLTGSHGGGGEGRSCWASRGSRASCGAQSRPWKAARGRGPQVSRAGVGGCRCSPGRLWAGAAGPTTPERSLCSPCTPGGPWGHACPGARGRLTTGRHAPLQRNTRHSYYVSDNDCHRPLSEQAAEQRPLSRRPLHPGV